MPLKLSIITPCYNRVGFIDTAVASVRQQWRDGMEHIIADGGSTDGTLDRLKKYDHLTVISEPDKNLYDAVNKGIAASNGDIVGWLNTDDRYLDGAFDAVMPLFEQDDTVDMVSGGARLVTLGAENDARQSDVFNAPANKNLNYQDLLFDVPIINARFFRRTLIDRVGPFSLDFMPASDREFLLRCAIAGAHNVPVDTILHEYVLHEGSATIRKGTAHWESMAKVHLAIADAHLNAASTPKALRAALRSFHAKNALIGAVGSFAQGHPMASARFIGKGWGRDLLWPLWAFSHSLHRLRR